MNDRTVNISELAEPLQEFVRECEVTGRKTWFTRSDRKVSVIVSHDEYTAMKESIEIGASADQRQAILDAENDITRNALLLVEDLLEA